jgi:hypothetical protein
MAKPQATRFDMKKHTRSDTRRAARCTTPDSESLRVVTALYHFHNDRVERAHRPPSLSVLRGTLLAAPALLDDINRK